MRPPEMIVVGELTLKRWQPEWAEEADKAMRESLPELAPFLAWATADEDAEGFREFVERSAAEWADGTKFNYAVFAPDGGLAGGVGLMARMGPGVLEIGYWMRTSYTRRGYMTAAVDALAQVALTLPGIERVAIKHDVANVASGRVAAKAGFIEVRREAREPAAPGDTGVDIVRERRA